MTKKDAPGSIPVLRRKQINPSTFIRLANYRARMSEGALHNPLYETLRGWELPVLKSIAQSWRRGKRIRDIAALHGLDTESIRSIVNALIILQEKAHSYGDRYSGLPKNFDRARVKPCLKCHEDFWSPDTRQIHMCEPCENVNSQTGDVGSYTYRSSHIHGRLF